MVAVYDPAADTASTAPSGITSAYEGCFGHGMATVTGQSQPLRVYVHVSDGCFPADYAFPHALIFGNTQVWDYQFKTRVSLSFLELTQLQVTQERVKNVTDISFKSLVHLSLISLES